MRFPGTFAGLAEKIPYLKSLGVTSIELMPVFEFDENIFDEYNLDNEFREQLYYKNVMRFIGLPENY